LPASEGHSWTRRRPPGAAARAWNSAIVASSRWLFQLKDGEQLYASSLPGNLAWTASANSCASPRSGVDVSIQSMSAYGAYARPRAMDACAKYICFV